MRPLPISSVERLLKPCDIERAIKALDDVNMVDPRTQVRRGLRAAVAVVWLREGAWPKLVSPSSGHEAIVAVVPFIGSLRARAATVAIGVGDTTLAPLGAERSCSGPSGRRSNSHVRGCDIEQRSATRRHVRTSSLASAIACAPADASSRRARARPGQRLRQRTRYRPLLAVSRMAPHHRCGPYEPARHRAHHPIRPLITADRPR